MQDIVKIPEGVTVRKEGSFLAVKGKLGEIKKEFETPSVNFAVRGNEVVFSSKLESRRQKKEINTFISELGSLIVGVQKGYTYKMKIVFTHFPVTVKVEKDKNRIVIENFLGERVPRYAGLFPGVEVKIQKQDVVVTGIDLYSVSQTAANIERAGRIVRKDRRTFQDGIYITEKKLVGKQ
jgi:large subunit ribosomal protein L6